MDEKIKEYTMDDLEDIIREYSSRPAPKEEPATATQEGDGATVRFAVATDATVRMDVPAKPDQSTRPLPDMDEDVKVFRPAKADPDPDEDVRVYQPAPKKQPPQPAQPKAAPEEKSREPIAFPHIRRPVQEDSGADEKGLGRLRAALIVHGALFLAAAVMALLAYRADGLQMKLMVAGELMILLLSALVGCRRLLEGLQALRGRSFRLESLLVVTLLVCALDGLLCLGNQNLPFGSVFSLQMMMAQWAEYQKRLTHFSQLDTLHKASDLTAVVKTEGYYKGQPAYQTTKGRLEDFMDHYQADIGPEKALCNYALGAAALGAAVALLTAILHGPATGMRVYAAVLLAAMPASTFVCIRRPEAILEKRMHKLGTVLCGWRGLQNIEPHGLYPLEHDDLIPANHVKLNGVRFYGERNVNTVVSYVAALMAADGGALAKPFEQLRASRNARVCRVEELTSYPDGIGGQIDGLSVIAGRAEFMENMGVVLPEGVRIPHAVYAAVNQSLCAVFAVSFTRSKSSASGLRTLCDSHHVRPILVDCDFVLTESFLEQKLEVDAHTMIFLDCATRMKLARKTADEAAPAIALATRGGLAQRAYAVTGGAALRSAWRAGAAVHMLGGGLGFLAVTILALQGSLFLLTPYNLLLYGCVWMIPGLLMAEWTRSV